MIFAFLWQADFKMVEAWKQKAFTIKYKMTVIHQMEIGQSQKQLFDRNFCKKGNGLFDNCGLNG